MQQKWKDTTVTSALILIAGFFLFWEWLRPLEAITDTGNVYLFVLFTALCFGLSYLVPNGWIRFLLKGTSLVIILDYLFLTSTFLSTPWMQQIYREVAFNMNTILSNEWYLMTPFFRSFLFLILLWLMSYLLHYWFVVAQKYFLFIALTVIYLAVLDTFTVYDAKTAIVRTFAIAFIALGISHFLQRTEGQMSDNDKKWENLLRWLTPVIVIVCIATIVGIYSPKLNPQWPDPVPFIQSTAGHVGFVDESQFQKKVGYGENDSRLGGSFVQDDSPVFEALANDRLYWRIESKDVYTGKGWERSAELEYEPINNHNISWRSFSDSVETTSENTFIQRSENSQLSKVAYPYGAREIRSRDGIHFFQDNQSGMMEYELSEQQQQIDGYTITYESPSYSIDNLQNISQRDPDHIQANYLQLPEDLPDRVSQLAEEITEGEETRYDQVKAVEQYFSLNGYSYQIEDVSIPDGNEDYVDQFLFETRVGYCDNFSTSMVVLLRSLDIPARWVKGFTGGDIKENQPENIPDGYFVYEITNNNAHSWVEVYFPETGWIPFEPTSGFTNQTEFYQETTSQTDSNPVEPEETEEETVENETEEIELEERDDEEAFASIDFDNEEPKYSYTFILMTIGVILLLLVLLGVIYYKRQTIKDWYLLQKWKKISQPMQFEQAYLFVLQLLDKRMIGRKKGQTLRQYAKVVDEKLANDDMIELTKLYEEYVYRKGEINKQDTELRELFEKLMKQIFA
ncbi:transglutaminaseTgpA domain-containing protein [Gracilibacillus sp. YIM 98692]|uniref:transglutaminase TgpA family protein n=1 Tax=Gracilibacillus sp. YIM 98692 TaxID=2663532 RepID=UPI0013D3491E|nr:transglutaminaseTgpA domain-containing protein [Gracilibacillus sp. YIM 98692]